MKAKTMVVLTILSLCIIGGAKNPEGEYTDAEFYRDSVSTLNLVNALYLTESQMKQLLDLNREYKKIRDDLKNSPELTALKKKSESDMKKLYEYLMSNPEKEDSKIQNGAAGSFNNLKEYVEKKTADLLKQNNDLLKKANSILTDEQLAVIDNFKPCIVPPPDLRDPVRAGQASSSSKLENTLDKLRSVKKENLDTFIKFVTDRYVTATNEKVYKMTSEEEKKKRDEISKLLRQAYSMSDTDFELKKDSIAATLTPEDKIKKLHEEIKERNPHLNSLVKLKENSVKKFLINPEIVIPILEKRMKSGTAGGLK
ncbi:MAG: hypothetical protein WCS96_12600 [Victivallales bacterium]